MTENLEMYMVNNNNEIILSSGTNSAMDVT